MLDFTFTDEQEGFRAVLRSYADKELARRYLERAAVAAYPMDAHRQLGDLGVLGIGLPEAHGGTGKEDPVLLGMITETLAYGDVNVAAAPVQLGLSAAQLGAACPDVQERWLPAVVAGEVTVGIALTEPGAGSDASALRTTAVPDGAGWRLSGEKTAITWATNAAAVLVYAREPGTVGSQGVSCFLVPLDADGVSVTPLAGQGCLPLGWGAIHLDDVYVGPEGLVGERGRGFRAVMAHFDFSRAALGLLCIGAAQASLDEAVGYATQREAFGRPIAEYQGISFALAEQATFLEGARWVCYRALWQRAAGLPHTSTAAMSKWWAPVVAKDAIEVALRVHGNLGYSTDLPLGQRLRDVLAYLIADGTAEIQKRIIAKDLFAKVR